jgi:hypothetical protein
MSEVNEGVQIILNRMESNPEEFFGDVGKWRWMFSENLREVMTEPEKAAIHSAMVKVRRLEITAKAVATVMPQDEEEEQKDWGVSLPSGGRATTTHSTWASAADMNQGQPKKMVVNRAQAEMIKRLAGENYK